jgi:hypothetical protein
MLSLLKLIGVLLLVVLFVGTGQILVSQEGRVNLWQMFWLGFIIWLWGYIILIQVKGREKMEEELKGSKKPWLIMQQHELEGIRIAAISALVAITFFYFSISWIFKNELILSTAVLLLTFWVSVQLQRKIFSKRDKNGEEY